MWSRIHLIPLLQAEEDRDVVRRDFAQKAMEKELLGKEVPIYNKDRYDFVTRVNEESANVGQIRTPDICCHAFQCNEIGVPGMLLCHVYILGSRGVHAQMSAGGTLPTS